jgi:predicted NBD/HSP70 family sugar kinase
MAKIAIDNLISGNHKIVRSINRAAILNLIREEQPISRTNLAKLSDLNKSTVSSIVSDLLKEKIIYETINGHSTGGRKPILLWLRRSGNLIGAIDFDPEFTYLGIGDIQGDILHKKAIILQNEEPESFIRRCVLELDEMRKSLNQPNFKGIGVSIPGVVDTNRGIIVLAPDLKWSNINIRKIFKAIDPQRKNGRVIFENEANSSALAELWFGNGLKNKSNIVFISEGIGTGIVLNKKLVQGSFDGAGQFGHTTIDAEGAQCICGNRGCWEIYTSNTTTVKRYFTLKNKDYRENKDNTNEQMRNLVALAKTGDNMAIKAIQETGRYLGIGISNIINGIDPEVIVLGGIITQAWDIIYPKIIQEIKDRVFFSIKKNVQVIPTSLKERTSLVGALTLVIREIFSGYKITI